MKHLISLITLVVTLCCVTACRHNVDRDNISHWPHISPEFDSVTNILEKTYTLPAPPQFGGKMPNC